MKHCYYFIILLYCSFIFSGCATPVTQYGASLKNVEYLQSMKVTNKVKVNAFKSVEPHNSINCRGTVSINTPDGKSFEEYIQDAFVSELKLAGIYDNASRLNLNGHFEELDSSSILGNAKWMFKITISSEGKESFTVTSEYPFSVNYIGDRACVQVPQAFVPAVQQLINEIVSHPKFEAMIR